MVGRICHLSATVRVRLSQHPRRMIERPIPRTDPSGEPESGESEPDGLDDTEDFVASTVQLAVDSGSECDEEDESDEPDTLDAPSDVSLSDDSTNETPWRSSQRLRSSISPSKCWAVMSCPV